MVAQPRFTLQPIKDTKRVPESEFSFDKCLGFLRISTEVSVGCGSRIRTYDLSEIRRASPRAILLLINVLDFYELTLKYRLVAGAGFEPTTYERYEERARGRIFF